MQTRNTATVVIVILALAVVAIVRGCDRSIQPSKSDKGMVDTVASPAMPERDPEIYDINSVSSGAAGSAALNPSVPESLKQVYDSYPRTDAGGDIVRAWEAVSPEQKKIFNEEIDKQIETARRAFEANPADKKAKHMLFIAETMKQLAADNFDYRRSGGSAVRALQSEVQKRVD